MATAILILKIGLVLGALAALGIFKMNYAERDYV